MTGSARRRWSGLVLAVLFLATGLALHMLAPDTAASDVAGDVLYALLVYALLMLVVPRLPAWGVAGAVLVWCTAVELFQLTGLPELWAVSFRPVVLVLGTVFDPRDLAVYAVAAIGAGVVDTFARPRVASWG